jgi:hypothetical protein
MDPLYDLDLNLAITFLNFELRSTYPSLNFVPLLGNSTELNILRLTLRLRFYDFYHHPWQKGCGATNRKVEVRFLMA